MIWRGKELYFSGQLLGHVHAWSGSSIPPRTWAAYTGAGMSRTNDLGPRFKTEQEAKEALEVHIVRRSLEKPDAPIMEK